MAGLRTRLRHVTPSHNICCNGISQDVKRLTAAGTVPDFHRIPLLHNPAAKIHIQRVQHKKRGKIFRLFLIGGSRCKLPYYQKGYLLKVIPDDISLVLIPTVRTLIRIYRFGRHINLTSRSIIIEYIIIITRIWWGCSLAIDTC